MILFSVFSYNYPCAGDDILIVCPGTEDLEGRQTSVLEYYSTLTTLLKMRKLDELIFKNDSLQSSN